MTSSNTLRAAWKAMQSEPQQAPGLYERRVHAHSGFTVIAGLMRPGMQLRFSVHVSSSTGTDGMERETPGFGVERQYQSQARQTSVSVELRHASYRDIFEIVAEDVVAHVIVSSTESAAIEAMRDRLNHWEQFMKASGLQGLSREDRIGLFGELSFLKTMLGTGLAAPSAVVASWKGPGSANQDFRTGARAVEIKATTGNSPSVTKISNEHQLDDADCDRLYLMLAWLREQEGGGQTLPQLVDEIEGGLPGSVVQEFADRLALAGYHPVHRHLYEDACYTERERHYYLVEGVFPRIRHADLRNGVSRVEYRINLAGFSEYRRPEAEAIAYFAGGLK